MASLSMSPSIIRATSRRRRERSFLEKREPQMSKVINHLYDSYGEAVAVIGELEAAGISHNDISIVANNVDKKNDPTHKDAAAKGAGSGAAGLGAVGAGAGVLA